MQDETRYLQFVKNEFVDTAHFVIPIGPLRQEAPATADAVAIGCEDHLVQLERRYEEEEEEDLSIPHEVEETREALSRLNDGKPAHFYPFGGCRSWGDIKFEGVKEEEEEEPVEVMMMREGDDMWGHLLDYDYID